MTTVNPAGASGVTNPGQPDSAYPKPLSAKETEVSELVKANMAAIDKNGDSKITWSEVKHWAKDNKDAISAIVGAGLDPASFTKNTGKGFSWQDIAKASGVTKVDGKDSKERNAFDVIWNTPIEDLPMNKFWEKLDVKTNPNPKDGYIGQADILAMDVKDAPPEAKHWLFSAQAALISNPINEKALTDLGFFKNSEGAWLLPVDGASKAVADWKEGLTNKDATPPNPA